MEIDINHIEEHIASTNRNEIHLKDENIAKARNEFAALAEKFGVFTNVDKLEADSKTLEEVGRDWYFFSKRIPDLLLKIASIATNKLVKENLLHIAQDERGFGNPALDHSYLFLETLHKLGLEDERIYSTSENRFIDKLIENVETMNDEYFNEGLVLGLEIIAYENIDTILRLTSADRMKEIKAMDYYRIHYIAEDEHINLNILNYLLIRKNKDHLVSYLKGFDAGLEFFKNFWNNIYRQVK